MYDKLATRYDDDILSVLSISSFLDPCYRSLSFLSNDKKESVKLAVEREATSISQSSSQAPDSVGCGKPPSKKLRGESALLDLVSDVIEPCISKDTVGKVASEVRMCAGEVQVKEDPLMWWKNHKNIYPHLAYLAQKYLNIPATSVHCERVFSKAGHIVNAKRASMVLGDNTTAAAFIGASVTLVLIIIFMILMVILVRQCLAFMAKRNDIRQQMEQHRLQQAEFERQRRLSVSEEGMSAPRNCA